MMREHLGGLWLAEPVHFEAIIRAAMLGGNLSALSPSPIVPYEQVPTRSGKNIAVVKLTGLLSKERSWFGGTSTILARKLIRQAAADPNVSAIVLAVDSPGGTVAGTDDLANDVRAATHAKRVVGHVDDLAASAAYWALSQTDAIYANSATALVGSIGTVLTVSDYSQAAEKDGVKVHVFATGPLKGAGSPGSQVNDDHKAYFQNLVNATQQHFDNAVKTGRSMTAAQLAAVRTGGVFPATEAKSLKLIDGIRSLDATIAALARAN